MTKILRIVLVLSLLVGTRVHALDAKSIFAKVSPATVLISDLDSQGSGFFVNDKGMILTNYHVVAARIDLKVKARVKFGDKVVLTELDDVKVVKVHPNYDLALLEVKPPPKGSFIPVQMVSRGLSLDTGSKCFAIGNPGGPDGDALELSITEGLISSASRKINGLEFVQFSAAVNPGNSGGPVCDESGRVFGIVTWKMEETEGISFAIPTQKLALTDFVELKERKPDTALMAQADRAATRYYSLSKLADGAERELLLQAAAECYRVMMHADSTRPEPYHNLGLVYRDVGQIELAIKYLEAALRIDPSYSNSCHLLGVIMIQADRNNADLCRAIWLRGVVDTREKDGASLCADDLAVDAMNVRRKPAAAAYMLRWSELLWPRQEDPSAQARRRTLWEDIRAGVPADEVAAIQAKMQGFNTAEYESLLEGKRFVAKSGLPPTVTRPTSTSTGTISAPTPAVPAPAPALSIDVAQLEQTAKATAARFNAQRVVMPPEGMEVPLPDQPSRAVMANAGCQIVMHFPNLGKLGVFNVAKADFDGFIDCPEKDAVFAAGAQVLLLYLPSTQMFELYDLFTLQKRGEVKSTLPGTVRFLGMGTLNPMRVFALSEGQANTFDSYFPHILNLPDLKEANEIRLFDDNRNFLFHVVRMDSSPQLDGSSDPYGARHVVLRPKTSPSGLYLYELSSEGQAQLHSHHTDMSRPSLARDGVLVATRGIVSRSHLISNDFRFDYNTGHVIRAAILGYAGAIENISPDKNPANLGTLRIIGLPSLNQVLDIPAARPDLKVDEIKRTGKNDEQGELLPIMLASAYSERLAYIVPKSKTLVLLALNLGNSSAIGGDIARPGVKFQRMLKVAQGSEVTVQSAPPGMRHDTALNALVWEVPKDFKTGQMVQVILLVKAPGGRQEYVIEKISVP